MSIDRSDMLLIKLREIRGLIVDKEFTGAEILCEEVLQQDRGNLMGLQLLGIAYAGQRKYKEAESIFTKCVIRKPEDIGMLGNLAKCFLETKKYNDAVLIARKMTELCPNNYRGYLILAMVAIHLGRMYDAKKYIDIASVRDPLVNSELNAYTLMLMRMHCCDWSSRHDDVNAVIFALQNGEAAIYCFDLLAMIDEPMLHRLAAEREIEEYIAVPVFDKKSRSSGKLRICYVSADFRRHATMQLLEGVLREHDKNLIEVLGVSIVPSGLSDDVQIRVGKYFKEFHQVGGLDDDELSEFINELDVDILIDLNGFAFGNRIGALARKPASVMINFLGYPGTMGTERFDYIIGDQCVTPADAAKFYSEKIIQLPYSYQPNEFLRSLEDLEVDCDRDYLPLDAFVFAAFNAPYKIGPEIFDVWMKLLVIVPSSVLWLICEESVVIGNLKREAARRGVCESRLIFSKKLPPAQHLKRHKFADLFLDTFPYGAHTTASDALRCGLPVLTCMGQSFASRVASSLLTAIGLPELIANDLDDYFAKALHLSRDSEMLSIVRSRLEAGIVDSPLFDPSLFARNLEVVYQTVANRSKSELPPSSFCLSDCGQISYF